MRRLVLVLLIILSPALAVAQSVEVFGVTGGSQVWDDEGNIGFGVPLGAGVGFRSPHGWGFEGLVHHQHAGRDFTSGVQLDSTVTSARARLLKYFGAGPVLPYAGGGFGVTHVKSARTEPPGFGGIFTSDTTSGTLSGFAGVRIPAGRLFVRPEFELLRAGEHLILGGNVAIGIGW